MANSHIAKLLLTLGLFSIGCTCMAQGNFATPAYTINTGKGGVAVAKNDGTINVGIDAEQLRKILDERDRKLAKEIHNTDPKDKQHIRQLEAVKKVLEKKLTNFEETFKEYQTKLAEQTKELEGWRGSVSDESLNKAQQALARGDTQAADQLLAEFADNLKSRRAVEDSKFALAYYQRGELASMRMDYTQALSHYAEAVAIQPDNPKYLRAAGTMARTLGHYEQAKSYLEHAEFLLMQQAPNSFDWSVVANELGCLYIDIAEYAKADLLFEHILEIAENAHGTDRFFVATILNNLAELYREQKKYSKAESLYLQSLKIKENSRGKDHPDVAITLNNLGVL